MKAIRSTGANRIVQILGLLLTLWGSWGLLGSAHYSLNPALWSVGQVVISLIVIGCGLWCVVGAQRNLRRGV